ncbi:probable disease resistance protein At1g58390 [Magnolia sinica]|uniref:probable disease resistance protein At1g58390 n=1 Tax=Magnolia sinica TaxID=86752 RepID=UPI00265B5C4F|nr:probable disease resistance protein At1g58390 [Magnolia sinica]
MGYCLPRHRKRLGRLVEKLQVHRIKVNHGRSSVVEEVNVVGIEDEAKKVVGRLIEGEDRLIEGEDRLTVVSITGTGGIGKTAFTKKVYNNINVKKSFDFHAWVHVSQEHQVRELLLSIIKCSKTLYGEEMETMLNERVGTETLAALERGDIWKYSSHVPSNLEKLGREIVAKCHGLPPAVVVLGGLLLKRDKSPKEWHKVLKSIEWWLNESEDQILSILALSFHDLPYYLKPCFLYFGALPEDSEFSMDDLISLWIAEGFVQGRGGEELEDVKEDYLQELVDGSMIQVVKRRTNGTAETCHLHDLLCKLSISKAKEDKFLGVYRGIGSTSPTMARRLAITHPGIGSFKFVRVMDLRDANISSLPNEIGYLIQLRLEQDPLGTLEKLSNLRILTLVEHCYIGKEMVCSAGGFPQLEVVGINVLDETEWRLESGGRSNAKS